MSVEERVTKLEVISEIHEKRLVEIQDHIKTMNDELGGVNAKLASLESTVSSLKEEINRSTTRNMVVLGIILSVINILINVAIRLLGG